MTGPVSVDRPRFFASNPLTSKQARPAPAGTGRVRELSRCSRRRSELIRERLAPPGYQNLKQPRFRPHEHLARRFAVNDQKYFLSVGTIRAYNHSAICRMRAKNRMRVVMPERQKALQLLGWNIRDRRVAGFRELLVMLADFHGFQVSGRSGVEYYYFRARATD